MTSSGSPPERQAPGQLRPGAQPDPPADGPADPARKLVIEGNKAWKAASEVRKRWLAAELFARRTAPREAAPFITRQLLAMPDPLRSGLAIRAGPVAVQRDHRALRGAVAGDRATPPRRDGSRC